MADEKLDKVQADIDHARKAAHDAHIIEDPNERHFIDSGDKSDVEDEAIAP